MSTADPFEMGLLHRAFRKGFRALSDMIQGVSPGDDKRTNLIGDHVDFLLVALHHHHAAEDELLWPKLHARIPQRDGQIHKIENQHTEIAASADSVRQILPQWIRSADLELAGPLAAAIEQLSNEIDRHLSDEEKDVVPLIDEYLNPQEWQEFLELGSSFLSEDNLQYGLVLAGMIRDGASPEEWQRFLARSPVFVQYLWNERGNYTYTRYCAALQGSGG